MTALDALNFVAFNPLQNKNPISVCRRKLIKTINRRNTNGLLTNMLTNVKLKRYEKIPLQVLTHIWL